jgi:hypothetical protein
MAAGDQETSDRTTQKSPLAIKSNLYAVTTGFLHKHEQDISNDFPKDHQGLITEDGSELSLEDLRKQKIANNAHLFRSLQLRYKAEVEAKADPDSVKADLDDLILAAIILRDQTRLAAITVFLSANQLKIQGDQTAVRQHFQKLSEHSAMNSAVAAAKFDNHYLNFCNDPSRMQEWRNAIALGYIIRKYSQKTPVTELAPEAGTKSIKRRIYLDLDDDLFPESATQPDTARSYDNWPVTPDDFRKFLAALICNDNAIEKPVQVAGKIDPNIEVTKIIELQDEKGSSTDKKVVCRWTNSRRKICREYFDFLRSIQENLTKYFQDETSEIVMNKYVLPKLSNAVTTRAADVTLDDIKVVQELLKTWNIKEPDWLTKALKELADN